jgi:hypothetical protein
MKAERIVNEADLVSSAKQIGKMMKGMPDESGPEEKTRWNWTRFATWARTS